MEKYILECLTLAKKAFDKDEVPVGAVIVRGDKIIAKAYNRRNRKKSALCHAEVIAIQKACKKLRDFRLTGCTLYVNLEPCAMCAGAILNARMDKVVFGAYESRSGCCGSKLNVLTDGSEIHKVEVVGGVLEEECAKIMKEFFSRKRKKK